MRPADTPPVFVGGIGGSGTRVLAALLKALGYHIGEDLNDSLDNLWFTALFKRHGAWLAGETELGPLYTAFRAASSGLLMQGHPSPRQLEEAMLEPRGQHPPEWLRERARSLLARLREPRPHRLWAWKEPNSQIHAERLLSLDPTLRYVHLARNGLDMAFSGNQNQLRFWGDLVLDQPRGEAEPVRSLRYWCWTEERMRRLRAEHPARVLWIRFEDLCTRVEAAGAQLAMFLGQPTGQVTAHLETLIETPSSLGRFREFDRECFHRDHLQLVASLGFPVS